MSADADDQLRWQARTTVWIYVGGYDVEPWRQSLAAIRPDLVILTGTDSEDLQDVEIAIAWAPPPGLLAVMPRLKAILALSAGAEALIADRTLPDVPIARFVHSSTQAYFRDYVIHAVLHHHRRMEEFSLAQRQRRWHELPIRPHSNARIGVLGLGALGLAAATALRDLNFPVSGWSRSERSIQGIETFQGIAGLNELLRNSDILISMLPSTPETDKLINADLLSRLPKGAYLINVGRGNHLVEGDLLSAIQSGHISGATLDVMTVEPPEPDHPFWSHDRIRLTPHIASTPDPTLSAEVLSLNIDRILDGRPPAPLVDRERGY